VILTLPGLYTIHFDSSCLLALGLATDCANLVKMDLRKTKENHASGLRCS
jgi:hypothetical protein